MRQVLLLIAAVVIGNDAASAASPYSSRAPQVAPAIAAQFAATGTGVDRPYTHCSLQDRQGHLWLGTEEGLYRYDGRTVLHFTRQQGLCDDMVYSLLEDRQGNIWVGTRDGVCRYDGAVLRPFAIPGIGTEGFNPFAPGGPFQKMSFRRRTVSCILQDAAGVLWFASGNGTLCSYDGQQFACFKYRKDVDAGWYAVPADSMDAYRSEDAGCLLDDEADDYYCCSAEWLRIAPVAVFADVMAVRRRYV